ncbi:four-helix bundle copper-binding protein [Ferruginibacter yonginensis]|uniref:Four-helix bundle copper-binding protein n=1 Tax=Ferruginibacter yonginensis TaxID=1310416 RepID=A0ABV8QUR0_9BACT
MTAYHQYQICIEACLRCAAICNHCAASCAQSDNATDKAKCIQLNMECAAICYATAELMSLGSTHVKELAKLCATMCDACADECRHHDDEHCRETAEVCAKCADECEIV